MFKYRNRKRRWCVVVFSLSCNQRIDSQYDTQYTFFGYGKVILFGEHFVVYDIPAIATALSDLKTYATIREYYGKGILIEDHTMNCNVLVGHTNGYVLDRAVKVILRKMGIDWDKESLSILIRSDIPLHGGMGTSAAVLVALSRLFSYHFKLDYSDAEINSLVYEGEKIFNGNPSGIDNTVSTYGNLIRYQKINSKHHLQSYIYPLRLLHPLNLVIGNTGISHDTAEVVNMVKQQRQQKPEKFRLLLQEIRKLVEAAELALLQNNLRDLGKLMTLNHQYLQKIDVSCAELDEMVNLALKNGALGAKMTGGGKGVCMIALVPNIKTQNKVEFEFQEAGYPTLTTNIG